MGAEVEKINGIAFASIEKINGRTDANIEKINGISFEAAAFGPPEFDALGFGSSGGNSGGVASTLTFSHTVGTGAGRGLVIMVMQTQPSGAAPSAPTGVTYDGVAMTQEGTQTSSGLYNGRVTLYTLIAPSSGENDCVVTFATSGTAWSGASVGSLSFEGLNQTDMADVAFQATHSASGSNNDNLTHANDATSTVAGQFCVSALQWTGVPINEALGTNMSGLAATYWNAAYGYQEATGTTTTMGYNFTNNASHASAHVGLKLLSDVYS